MDNGRNLDRFLTTEMREQRADLRDGAGSKRSREERLQHMLIALNNQRLAEKLREAHKGFDDTANKGQELLARIAALRARWEKDYAEFLRPAPRHPVTGEAMFRDQEEGVIRTKNGDVVMPEEIAGLDVSGAPSWAKEKAWQGRFTELDHLETRVENGLSTVESAGSRMDSKIEKDPENAEAHIEEGEAVKAGVDSEFGEIGGRLEELDVERSVEAKFQPDQVLNGQVPSLVIPVPSG